MSPLTSTPSTVCPPSLPFPSHCSRSCADYDLCEFCESQEGIHQEDHLFLKVRRPLSRLGMNKKGKMKPLLKKNVYSKASELE